MSARPTVDEIGTAALVESFPFFLTALLDHAGRSLELPAHVLEWADLMADEPRLVLRAPRSHGKSTLLLALVLWHCWRHGRVLGQTGPGESPGIFDVVMFSATHVQALELMARLRDLLVANERLFARLLPEAAASGRRRTRWSATEVRLRNGAIVRIRAYGASVRGLHPDLLLFDDILNDANSLSGLQRDKTYTYFMGTLLPMDARRIVLIGTAIHQDDLLAHLGRGMGHGSDLRHTPLGFRAVTYRALDEETGETLWPERFPLAKLVALRDADPLIFAREYQNEPRDDASALVPYALTQRAIDAGASYVLGAAGQLGYHEHVVLGVDLARSPADRADFTVAIVAVFDAVTGTRRVVDIRRVKGLPFRTQFELIRDLVVRHGVLRAVVENNGFQQWLLDELARDSSTAWRVEGHRTGPMKGDLRDGVPRLAHEFQAGRWILPSGDVDSLRQARQLQRELGAFVFRDGRPVGVGEHDDMVIAAWLVERAIKSLIDEAQLADTWEIVTAEDLGIERVRIGPDF